jgi:hypothetical protein
MARYTVRKGRWYRAMISLGIFERLASNERVAQSIREAGFIE